jgi:energy-coupling factor transporter ATP-binding protein EcfA2
VIREAPIVEAKPWEDFEPWFRRTWRQGEHVACIGPTGFGKTTVIYHLMAMRRHALALDVKGGDRTLAKLQRVGFKRVAWPLEPSVYRDVRKGRPAQFIVGFTPRVAEEMARLKAMIARCLHDVFSEGGWTVYVDELQMAASPKMMNLGGIIELNLIAARNKGVSILTSFQAPRWVPRAASDQSEWLFVFPSRDRDVVDRLAEMAGRPREEVQGAIRGLGAKSDHMVLVVGTDPFAPMIVTRAPKV